MNIMRTFKNILTATALVLMAVGLSSCYFRMSDDAKKQLKDEMRSQMHDTDGEVDTVTYTQGELHSTRSESGTIEVTADYAEDSPIGCQ